MTLPTLPQGEQDRLKAGVDLIGRTGATSFQIRFQDDEEPVVWIAVAEHRLKGQETHYEVDASVDPVHAVVRLCERLVDGGLCNHCGRPAGMEPYYLGRMPLGENFCWYQYDPELKTYRRACEGDAP